MKNAQTHGIKTMRPLIPAIGDRFAVILALSFLAYHNVFCCAFAKSPRRRNTDPSSRVAELKVKEFPQRGIVLACLKFPDVGRS